MSIISIEKHSKIFIPASARDFKQEEIEEGFSNKSPTLSSLQVKLTSEFSFVNYFKIFFNFIFFVGLSPFFLHDKKSSSGASTTGENILQKIICILIHISSLVFLSSVFLSLLLKPLEEDPSGIYSLVTRFMQSALNISIISLVWNERGRIGELLCGAGAGHKSKELTPWCTGRIKICVVIGIIFSSFMGTLIVTNLKVFEEGWLMLGSTYLPHWNYPFNISSPSEPEGLLPFETFLSISSMSLISINLFITHLGEIITVLNIFAVNQIIVLGTNKLIDDEVIQQASYQDYVNLYINTESIINNLNDIFGNVILTYFCYKLAFLTSTFVFIGGSSEEITIPFKSLLIINLVFGITLMVYAAMVYDKGTDFKDLLIEKASQSYRSSLGVDESVAIVKNPSRVGASFIAYLEMTDGNLGIRGSDFFTFSFGFLGKTLIFSLTFILVMIQIMPSPGKESDGKSVTNNSTTTTIQPPTTTFNYI